MIGPRPWRIIAGNTARQYSASSKMNGQNPILITFFGFKNGSVREDPYAIEEDVDAIVALEDGIDHALNLGGIGSADLVKHRLAALLLNLAAGVESPCDVPVCDHDFGALTPKQHGSGTSDS